MLEVSEPSQWRHVPGDLNLADELSRGLMPPELWQDHRWFTGPPFLSLPPGNWPLPVNAKDLAATPEELVECLAVSEADEPLDALIHRAGNLHRLVRVAAWILRSMGNVRARIRSKRTAETDSPYPSSAVGKYAPALETSPRFEIGPAARRRRPISGTVLRVIWRGCARDSPSDASLASCSYHRP